MRLPLCGLLGLLLLTGCASNFTPYEGAQQNWPVSQGGLVNRKYSIPIYHGPPPQPYIVMGTLSNDDLQDAARAARKLGADAIIVLNTSREYAGSSSSESATVIGNMVFGSGSSRAKYDTNFLVAAIRWRR